MEEMVIMKYIKRFWGIITSGANLYKTVIFNFRMLPFKEAICLPIWLYGKVDISRSTGSIHWTNPTKVHTGGWRIGQAICVLNGTNISRDVTILSIQGVLKLGEHGHIMNGCHMYVKCGSVVELGDRVVIAEHIRICSFIGITIGEQTRISWDSQIMDTDFHYVLQPDGTVYLNKKKINIGNRVWIGNHVTISKGAGVGEECIIASNSLLNHDYSNVKNGLFVGIPAKLLKEGVCRVFDWNLEKELDDFFVSHPEAPKCTMANINGENSGRKFANTPPRE